MKTISIARDFSQFPAGRFRSDGPYSGEKFRQEVLVPALSADDGILEVNLDDTMGYGSSFLEESFGGLIREEGFKLRELKRRLRLLCSDESYIDEVNSYLASARAKK